MAQIENALNALGAQTLFSAMTSDDISSQHQEQKDNYSEEISPNSTPTPTEHMEIPQSDSTTSILDLNCNESNSSDSSTISTFGQSDIDAPFNPISFLNTMHQKLKNSKAPVYSFSHDPATGQFYCKVNFCEQVYENNNARQKKQQAKEDAASIAMKDLSLRMPEITESIRQELIRAHVSQKASKYENNKNGSHNQMIKRSGQLTSYQQQAPHPLELIPKSIQWYNRQVAQASSNGQMKRPCVLLLEFCQMHKLGHPTYNKRDDGRGCYLFDCTVFGRTFNPTLSFWKKSDAKDHVSNIAFGFLYKEFCEKEAREIQGRMQPYRRIPTSPVNVIPPTPPPPPPNVAYPSIYPNVTDGYVYYC